jgi:hypothetical protein
MVPLLLIIFGLWAIKNVRRLGRVNPTLVKTTNVAADGNTSQTNHSKDRQLLRVMLVDVSIYLTFSCMMSVVLIYQLIITDESPSAVEIQLRGFYLNVSIFISYIPVCIGFYNNLLISKAFRKDTIRLLTCK